MNDSTGKFFVMDFWMKGLRFRDELNTMFSLILLHIKQCLFGMYTCTLIFIKCTMHISSYNNKLKKIQNNSNTLKQLSIVPCVFIFKHVWMLKKISVFALCFLLHTLNIVSMKLLLQPVSFVQLINFLQIQLPLFFCF